MPNERLTEASTLETAKLVEIHDGVKAIDAILDRWANDESLPIGVRSACVQSEGSLAHILTAAIRAAA